MSKRTKFGEWWYYNAIFFTVIALAILIPVYIFAIPNYSRNDIQESTVIWEKPDKGKGFWIIEIDGDTWYTYDKYDYYDLEDGSEAGENTERCLDKVFEMQQTNSVNKYLKNKEDKNKEEKLKKEQLEKENEKLKEENNKLKKNLSEL